LKRIAAKTLIRQLRMRLARIALMRVVCRQRASRNQYTGDALREVFQFGGDQFAV